MILVQLTRAGMSVVENLLIENTKGKKREKNLLLSF